MTEAERPAWTVGYNIVSPENPKWIGRGWEFFDHEADAERAYELHCKLGNCPAKRPYFHASDRQYLHVLQMDRQ